MTDFSDPQNLLKQAAKAVQEGNFTVARAILSDILKANPNNADAWYIAAFATNEREQKIRALERALNIDPSHEKARQLLDRLRPTPLAALTTKQDSDMPQTSARLDKLRATPKTDDELDEPPDTMFFTAPMNSPAPSMPKRA